jgi:hypothetical protein
MTQSASAAADASIVVATTRQWYGDPRLGTFTVYLDGAKVGTVPPQGSLRIPCSSGRHRVRVRQWWYRSPPFEVTVAAGGTSQLDVDLVRDGSVLRRLLILMFAPWRGVAVSAVPDDGA